MPGFFPRWREAQREEARQELQEARHRNGGSHRLSGAGCSALQGGCSSHHCHCHLPTLLSMAGLTQHIDLGFPTQEQPWEVGGGSRSAPCSRCFLSALIFFSCGSREQPVSQITKASDRHCWGMWSTVYAPRLLPTIILHPGTATEMLRAGSILQTLAHLQDAVGGVGGRSRMLNPPILPRQTQKCPPMGREGPAACCQMAEGKGRNANGIQVLANGFAVSWECGPDMRVQRGWMVEQGDLCGC